MVELRNVHKILVGKADGKITCHLEDIGVKNNTRPTFTPKPAKCRVKDDAWEDIIKMNLKETGCEGVGCIH
jgi:hypothetical protein